MRGAIYLMFDKIFKIENSTPSHISFRIFGIKLNCLKSGIKKERKEITKYYQSFESASQIPRATGNLRLIQLANANFLKKFDKVCSDNNFKYWIDFGTLLGALRHKGFIPWDDDIDISMPRDDYERLIEFFEKNSNVFDDFELIFESNKKTKCFVKIKSKYSHNLFIDIFPYDFYHSELNSEQKMNLSEKIVNAREKNLTKKIDSISQLRAHFKDVTTNFILENQSILTSKQPLFMGIDFPHKWKQKVFDWDAIFPLRKIKFEDIEFSAPNNPDAVLKSIYGNYMEIPKDSYPRHSNYINLTQDEKNDLERLLV